ncbi:hypothetical protein ElyMa_000858500 [Elysia marginata]|uniref:Uncharacterized protein n=1 Tax=Elysia marginata TaxID=1093978 RepID=A0AAV4H1I5_9GAST|nr:hypothetical protein ElyMa_000858500 [Elysia marginata]
MEGNGRGLDIWHFMQRLASCMSSESHQLYAVFIRKLSGAIFQWDDGDVKQLQEAKAKEIQSQRLGLPGELTSKELNTHCQRITRGAAEMEALIEELLTALTGDAGLEAQGVPFFNIPKLKAMWEQQRSHCACIQDPPGISLYKIVGRKSRGGGVDLPIYRCTRGTVSLESFHLHLNRFIQGEITRAVNFQAYLLEGLVRWNEDRHPTVVGKRIMLLDYKMQCDAVTAATKLGVEPVVKPFHPASYMGEFISVEYLFSQTGKPLGHPDEKEEEAVPEELEEEEELAVEVEEAVDFTIPPPPGASPAASPVVFPAASPLTSPESASTIICRPPHLMEEAPEAEQQEEPSQPGMVLDEPTSDGDMDTNFRNPAGQGDLDRLMALARHLVEFKNVDILSNKQVAETIDLYNNLAEVDKARIKYPARQKTSLSKGRFAHSKSDTISGVLSVKRGFFGGDSSSAQWPSLSRLVENMISLLLEYHPAGERTRGGQKDRWQGVLLDYMRIRRLVLSNRELVQHAMIQLFEVNTRTLRQW